MNKKDNRLFVHITSYRDSECLPTLKDLFANAAKPERISVGICVQDETEAEENIVSVLKAVRPGHVNVAFYNYVDGQGANWARAEAFRFWENEEYSLYINAHSRFAKGWDEILIQELKTCPAEKPVLSTFPANYECKSGALSHIEKIPFIRVEAIERSFAAQLITLAPRLEDDKTIKLFSSRERVSPFISASFIFAKSSMFKDVPYDPYVYFYGFDVSMSLRLWTHGYTIFQPSQAVLWHHQPDPYSDGKPYKNQRSLENSVAAERIRHLAGIKPSDDALVVKELDRFGHGDARPLEDFWRFAGVDLAKSNASVNATKGKWNVKILEKFTPFTNIGAERGNGCIFVQIASYRDQECQYTVQDLFAKAKHPERIFLGICWQYDEKEDSCCFEIPHAYPDQVRVVKFDWREAEGVCWARHETQKLWRGEEYTLQIDSHSRFVQDWDVKLVEELAACPSPKPFLSGGLGKYTPPNELEKKPMPSVLRSGAFDEMGNLRNRGATLARIPDVPLNAAFISGGFFFARAEVIEEVPYDPYMYFDQEEISYAMRLYTHGWDIFSSRRVMVYHYYIEAGKPPRPLHWNDMHDEKRDKQYSAMRMRGVARFDHLTGYKLSTEKPVIKDLQKYGVGNVRTIEQYERYCGIDFRQKKMSERAMRGEFIDGLERWLDFKVYAPELDDKDKKLPACLALENDLFKHHIKDTTTERIFVFIASYRDRECQHTIKDLFLKAMNPERIFVGICWQFDPQTDTDCFEIPAPYPAQVRSRRYHPSNSQGLGWARAEALSLHRDEEYVLQIDAHMRFEAGWDAMLIDMHKRCPTPKSAITAYLPNYSPPDDLQPIKATEMTRINVSHPGAEAHPTIVHLAGTVIDKMDARAGLYPSPMVVFNFIFAPIKLYRDVPLDKFIVFHGGEITFSARMWTHGWNIYQPDRNVAYHRWVSTKPGKNNVGADSYKRIDTDAAQRTRRRVRHVLGIQFTEDEADLRDLDYYGHGTERDLDAFWQFLGYNPEKRQLTDEAKRGHWDIPAREDYILPALAVEPEHPRIFVQIAAYRDPDCQHTVRDIFEKATHPERIFIGICWQSVPEEDQHCFEIETRPAQVRIVHYDARESKGCCWARHQVQKLWNGEEYTMQIDAHMRFEKGWDETALAMLKECNSPRPVLTAYPPGYTPPNDINSKVISKLCAKRFNDKGIIYITGNHIPLAKMPPKPWPGAFIGACFIFGPSSIISDVPYDPHLYFFGEEITLAVRMWTHGYDLFMPHRPLVYHDWKREARKSTHFKDHKDWRVVNDKSFARVRHLLGIENIRDQAIIYDIDKYGLGNIRTLEEYEQFAGVRFATSEISNTAIKGVFPAPADAIFKQVIEGPQNKKKPQKPDQPHHPKARAILHRPDAAPSMAPAAFIKAGNNSGPIKTFETPEAIVYDNFLPDELYEKLYNFAAEADYQYVKPNGMKNANGNQGLPLRTLQNAIYRTKKQEAKKRNTYPTGIILDRFIEHVKATTPDIAHIIGESSNTWDHFSAASWLYAENAGLGLHETKTKGHSGSYMYFLNPEWKPHWGGLLLLLNTQANQEMQGTKDVLNSENILESGFAHCILPKRNRMVFIASNAYHMVTKVSPGVSQSRLSLAGMFSRENK